MSKINWFLNKKNTAKPWKNKLHYLLLPLNISHLKNSKVRLTYMIWDLNVFVQMETRKCRLQKIWTKYELLLFKMSAWFVKNDNLFVSISIHLNHTVSKLVVFWLAVLTPKMQSNSKTEKIKHLKAHKLSRPTHFPIQGQWWS